MGGEMAPEGRADACGGVVVLASGPFHRPGGMALRWRALREALGRHVACALRELGCHRLERCRPICQATGALSRSELVWHHPPEGEVWLGDRYSCEDYALRLAEELVASGVSTVICSGLETHRYVSTFAATPDLTVIYDMHNVEVALHRELQQGAPPGSYYASILSQRSVELVGQAEGAAVAAADALWVCSARDRDLLAHQYDPAAPARATVVPNVVEVPGTVAPAPGCERVCYVGRMDYYQNVAAAWTLGYEIAPLLRTRGHDVPVVIAGAYAQEMLAGPGLPAGVELISSPASAAELVAGSIVAVPLTMGGGTRLKILEAFAYGAPVVSTAKGIEGIDAVSGQHYLLAGSPAEFAAAIGELIGDPALRERLAGAAWELVKERYSVDALAARLGPTARQLARSRP